ncbi:helix-turn-helix domain-containing protein [Nocardiopsis sp. N85]|uniref:helix-turn-helix domain-containing protein n=1 Tax=Nocardiopsis sp. N85 TaxID=3029400 RepID=UPI00237FA62D|nr:helix-turn-helix domain-containing protein [Nocardiopsis sp. N85]MDE3722245.1 helix-turn-helix domain-containing protein [Nocardiopsis sp. N85]
MRELLGRVGALDPQAEAAVKVIAYFDRLHGAGLEPLVRGATVLSGLPAALVDPARALSLRARPDGHLTRTALPDPDPAWPHTAIGTAVLWVETTDPAGPVLAMVLERAAAAIGDHLDRTPPPAPPLAALLTDPDRDETERLAAARRAGLPPATRLSALAPHRGPVRLIAPGEDPGAARAGVGPAASLADLPGSLADARRALRFTATGTGADPGPVLVRAEHVGALLPLADTVRPDTPPPPDVAALDRLARDSTALIALADALATAPSVRAAAAALGVHHSTAQQGLERAERLLGWNVRTVPGRLRLQIALQVRRLYLPD